LTDTNNDVTMVPCSTPNLSTQPNITARKYYRTYIKFRVAWP